VEATPLPNCWRTES